MCGLTNVYSSVIDTFFFATFINPYHESQLNVIQLHCINPMNYPQM